MRDVQKVIRDYTLAAKETIFLLQQWLAWLEQQPGEGVEFELRCQQLREAGLGNWLEIASGYDLQALRQAISDSNSVEAIERVEWD